MSTFTFKTKYDQEILLGRRAKHLSQLLDGIETVPASSIFLHTHRALQQNTMYAPEPPNDFAYWVTNRLGYERLGEELASVDIVQFRSVEALRHKFIRILRTFIGEDPHTDSCVPGHEFHFMACHTFVLPTPFTANSLAQFRECLRQVHVTTLRYHILDRTLRGDRGENDFSAWFREIGNQALADELAALDPYTQTMEGLRNRILKLVERHESD
jgi:hypothetical protein